MWSRLQTICPYGDCEKVETKDIKPNEWILDLEDIEKDTGKIISVVFKKDRNSVSTKHKFYKGQLLYSKLRPYLNKVVIATNDGYCTSEILPLKLFGSINPCYIQIFLMSTIFLEYVNMISYGVKMPRLGTEDGRKALIAIPPLGEQSIIVTTYDNIKPLIKCINDNVKEVNKLIELIKIQILDLAIRGKLVPQNPDDEPASVLLERIRAEKEELIKQGKIKRDKKESVIFKGEDNSYYETVASNTICINENLPFDLPSGWSWCKLKSLSAPCDNSFVDGPFGSNLKKEHYTTEKEVRIIQLNNIGELVWRNTGVKYTTFEHAKALKRCISYPGDIVIAKMMPAGRAIIIPNNIDNTFVISSDCVRLKLSEHISNKYIMYMINSSTINRNISGDVHGIGRSRTSLGKLKEIIVPIPPLSEQTRIVEAIETAFAQLDEILNSIA